MDIDVELEEPDLWLPFIYGLGGDYVKSSMAHQRGHTHYPEQAVRQ